MVHLQQRKAMHRDLKLANILLHFPDMVNQEDKITSTWLKDVDMNITRFQIKIADLGFSKIQKNINDFSMTYCGTPINMAPEVLNRMSYNYKADVWSLGTIVFDLVTGFSPFSDDKKNDQLRLKQ